MENYDEEKCRECGNGTLSVVSELPSGRQVIDIVGMDC